MMAGPHPRRRAGTPHAPTAIEERMAEQSHPYAEELALANELADLAAEVAVEVYGREFEVRRKADLTPVTEADLRIEGLVRDRIVERFPGDAVLGEEGGLQGPGDGGRRWVVDPIDGTKNFAARIQIWATLIALAVDGRPVLGVIEAPLLGERYEAVQGQGARLNGRPIHVSDVERVPEALVSTAGTGAWLGGPNERAFLSLAAEAERVRGFGDFWGHMLVARGAADVMLETALRTWDWAALAVIVEEAGGRCTQLDGSPLADGASVLSANPALHAQLVARFRGDA